MNDFNRLEKAYPILMILKKSFISIFMVCLYESAIAQVSTVAFLLLSFLAYLLIIKPFKDRKFNIYGALVEAETFAIFLFMLIIVISSYGNNDSALELQG